MAAIAAEFTGLNMRSSVFIFALSTLVLCACSEQGRLAPEDVLNRSSVANSGLLSARVSMNARLTSPDAQGALLDGYLTVQGNMQEGGRQLDLNFATQGARSASLQPMSWKASGRLIALSDNETYIRADEFESDPAFPILALASGENITNTWFRLPSAGQTPTALTPDPRFLRLQSEAVRVTKDHGIDTVNGVRMYHYDVVLDPERFTAFLRSLPETDDATSVEGMLAQLAGYDAAGELWIEEKSFLLTKATWTITKKNDEAFSLTLSMELTDVGLPVTITAPEDAKFFPQMPLFPSADALILQEF
jgi:hypothetical protein